MSAAYDSILSYTESLLSAAIQMCGRVEDAEDLTEETLLAALTALARGDHIEHLQAWLFSVLKRKHHDLLRAKYRKPTLSFDTGFDALDIANAEDTPIDSRLLKEETCEEVRRQVAYLAEQYRVIIVKYYFRGESIQTIAGALGIPVGTVKSRLDFSRKQLKKGIETMQTYSEYSYMPKYLHICNSGCCGDNMEPSAVVQNDVLAQNLLILAYEKPVSVTELSRAIGVSAAYVEPVVQKLLREELMRKTGDGRVYTDFIIYKPEDFYRSNRDKQKFCEENIDAFFIPMRTVIEKLKKTDIYSERLERFLMIDIAGSAIWNAGEPFRKPQIFPDRPNGGRWIAFATVYQDASMQNPVPKELQAPEEWGIGGRRTCEIKEYVGAKNLLMMNYDTSLNPAGYGKFESLKCHTYMENEEAFLKLAYLIEKGIDPTAVGYPEKHLDAIPGLCREGFLAQTDGRISVRVPRLTHAQADYVFTEICRPAVKEITERLTKPMGDYLRQPSHRCVIPPHLDSVPEQKLTMPHEPPAMGFVYEAIKHGLHKRDLGGPCPETLLIFD